MSAPSTGPSPLRPQPPGPAVTGQPWPLRVECAPGIGFVAVETDHLGNLVPLAPVAGSPGVRAGELPVLGAEPFRYRFVWRSSWNGGTTEWQSVTPSRPG